MVQVADLLQSGGSPPDCDKGKALEPGEMLMRSSVSKTPGRTGTEPAGIKFHKTGG